MPSNKSKITEIPQEDILAVEQSLGLKPMPERAEPIVLDNGTVIESNDTLEAPDMAEVLANAVDYNVETETLDNGTVLETIGDAVVAGEGLDS